MEKIGVILLLVLSFSASASERVFGAGANKAEVVSVQTLLAQPQNYIKGEVTVEGVVDKVCMKRGCWLSFKVDDGNPSFIVKVRDGDMVFPMSSIGKKAYATGVLVEQNLDVENTRKYLAHRAMENKLEFDPGSVTQGMTLYRLNPTGVTIEE